MKNIVCLQILLSNIQRTLSSPNRHSYTEYKMYTYLYIYIKKSYKKILKHHFRSDTLCKFIFFKCIAQL